MLRGIFAVGARCRVELPGGLPISLGWEDWDFRLHLKSTPVYSGHSPFPTDRQYDDRVFAFRFPDQVTRAIEGAESVELSGPGIGDVTVSVQIRRPRSLSSDRARNDAVFVFDANVLLNLYRYTEDTRTKFLGVLPHLGHRIGLPHQAAFEFHRGRPGVILEQEAIYEQVESDLKNAADGIQKRVEAIRREEEEHPVLELVSACKDLAERARERQKDHPDLMDEDPVTDAACEKLIDRLAHDLILWFQLIDFVKEEKRPIIFVTDDSKEDWWWEKKGRTLGPRPELGTGAT